MATKKPTGNPVGAPAGKPRKPSSKPRKAQLITIAPIKPVEGPKPPPAKSGRKTLGTGRAANRVGKTIGVGTASDYANRKAMPQVAIRPEVDRASGQAIKARLIQRCAHDVSPLEVMLDAMLLFHEDTVEYMHQCDAATNEKIRLKYRSLAKYAATQAVSIAKEAAPYIHAKLQTTTLKGDPEDPVHLSMYDAATLRAAVRGTDG